MARALNAFTADLLNYAANLSIPFTIEQVETYLYTVGKVGLGDMDAYKLAVPIAQATLEYMNALESVSPAH
jgi:hypothetical protein